MARSNRIKRLRDRLRELEAAEAGSIIFKTVYGHVKRLPQDYVGERHTVITKHLGMQNGQESVRSMKRCQDPTLSPTSLSSLITILTGRRDNADACFGSNS